MEGDLLANMRAAYVAAKQGDTERCVGLLEWCLAVVKPAKERKVK